MTETTALAEFGKKACTVAGYEDCWVRFKTNGYPRKLRKEWSDTTLASQIWDIVMRYVTDWSIRDLSGQAVALPAAGEPRPYELWDNVEDALSAWLTNAFVQFWLTELTAPRPNS